MRRGKRREKKLRAKDNERTLLLTLRNVNVMRFLREVLTENLFEKHGNV